MGAGQTKSSSKYSAFNQSLVNVMLSASQKCATQIQMQQIVDVSGDYNVITGVKMAQGIQFKLNCAQMQQSLANIRNDMSNAIEQQAKATGQIASMGSTVAEASANIVNQVSNAVTMQSINELFTTVNMAQMIKVNGKYNLLRDFDMQQTSEIFADASQKILGQIEAVTTMDNKATQSTTSETKNPLSFLTDWLSGLGSIGIIIIIAVLVGAYFFLGPMFKDGDGASPFIVPRPPGMPFGPPMMPMPRMA